MFYSETRRAAPFGTPIIGSSDGSFTIRETDPQESSLCYYGKQELSAERYRCFVKISLRRMGNVRFPEICVLIFVPQKI